jgi:chemotaxis protein methyltransferase CheR
MSPASIGVHPDAPPLGPREFDRIRRAVYDRFGLDLSGKEVLVATRLRKLMRRAGFVSFRQYYDFVERDSGGEALTEMMDALTTNYTSFFREPQHFDYLRTVILPSLPSAGAIRIWSAACSTGEEPYSIAFTLLGELGPAALSRVAILATDISTRALAFARRGVYDASRLADLPRIGSCLLKGSGRSEGTCMVRETIRSLIRFERLNLMESFSAVGSFSVIFCRNVMIYFDRPTRQSLVNRLAAQLLPGGYLLVGHAESLNGIDHPLHYLCPAVYRRPESRSGLSSRKG